MHKISGYEQVKHKSIISSHIYNLNPRLFFNNKKKKTKKHTGTGRQACTHTPIVIYIKGVKQKVENKSSITE